MSASHPPLRLGYTTALALALALQVSPAAAQTSIPFYTSPLTGCTLGGAPGDITRPTCSESWAAHYGGTWTCDHETVSIPQPITCSGFGTTSTGIKWANTFTQASYPIYSCLFGGVGGPDIHPYRCDLPSSTVNKAKNLGTCQSGNKDARMVADAINPATGATSVTETDYVSDTLQVVRTYSSQADRNARSMGALWRHNYSRDLRFVSGGATPIAGAERADGRLVLFSQNSNGDWLVEGNQRDTLKARSDGTWELLTGGNVTEVYDAEGKLLSTVDLTGLTTTLTYGATGRLSTVTDASGRQLTYAYDGQGRPTSITLPDGAQLSYSYDASSNLSSVTYPDSSQKQYLYNETAYTGGAQPNALTGVTDEAGQRISFAYDNSGRAVATERAGGAERTSLTYGTGGLVTLSDPRANTSTLQFAAVLGVAKPLSQSQPAGAGCGPASKTIALDAYGNVISRTDFNGNKTCAAFDVSRSLEVARVEGLAPGVACPPDLLAYVPVAGSAEKKTLIAWHPSLRLPLSITEHTRLTQFEYDARGNQTKKTISNISKTSLRTWTTVWTYHANGMVLKKTEDGPRSGTVDVTTTQFYAPDEACVGGHLGCRGQIKSVTNALGQVTAFTRYNAHGQLEETIDANGLVTTQSYDARQRLRTSTQGTVGWVVSYDAGGRLLTVAQSDGRATLVSYDGANRISLVEDGLGARTKYSFDASGNPVREDVETPTNTISRTGQREFDALQRQSRNIGATNTLVKLPARRVRSVLPVTR